MDSYLFIYFFLGGGFKNLKNIDFLFQRTKNRIRRRRMNEHSVCMNEDIPTNYFFFTIFFVRDFQNVYKNARACALSLTHTHTHTTHTQIYTPFTSLHFISYYSPFCFFGCLSKTTLGIGQNNNNNNNKETHQCVRKLMNITIVIIIYFHFKLLYTYDEYTSQCATHCQIVCII